MDMEIFDKIAKFRSEIESSGHYCLIVVTERNHSNDDMESVCCVTPGGQNEIATAMVFSSRVIDDMFRLFHCLGRIISIISKGTIKVVKPKTDQSAPDKVKVEKSEDGYLN